MGSEWTNISLGEIVQLGGGFVQTGPFGSQLHASDYVEKGIPCIMPANISDSRVSLDGIAQISEDDARRLSRHLVQVGDIVYSRRGDVTRKALIRKDEAGMFCGTGCLLIRPGDAINSQFLAYHLSSPRNKEWIVRHAIGATMPNLNTSIMSEVPLRVPGFGLQKAIAHVLGSQDDRIELNQQMNETLESMAQALFKSWFVDFDPVIDNALASGKEIPEELQKRAQTRAALGDKRQSLPAEIRTLFPDGFVYSDELGWIPEGWEVKTVNDEIETVGGGTPKTKEPVFWEGGIHAFCTPKDMSNMTSRILTYTARHLTEKGVDKISSGQLPIGTILMSSRAPIGYLAITDIPISVNQGIIAMKNDGQYGSIFLQCWTFFNMERIKERANGSTFLEISKKNFRTIPFLAPHDQLTNAYNQTTQPMLERMISCTHNSTKLTKLRDTLLPKLLSGELRIPDAEKMVEELAL